MLFPSPHPTKPIYHPIYLIIFCIHPHAILPYNTNILRTKLKTFLSIMWHTKCWLNLLMGCANAGCIAVKGTLVLPCSYRHRECTLRAHCQVLSPHSWSYTCSLVCCTCRHRYSIIGQLSSNECFPIPTSPLLHFWPFQLWYWSLYLGIVPHRGPDHSAIAYTITGICSVYLRQVSSPRSILILPFVFYVFIEQPNLLLSCPFLSINNKKRFTFF